MSQKKVKKQRPNIHTEFHLTEDACNALSNALLFMLSHNDFSFANEKISYDSAARAEEKLFDGTTDLTRGEVRAAAKAVDLVLSNLPDKVDEYAYMDSDFPDLRKDLMNELSILKDLKPVFEGAVKDLCKKK